MSIKISKGAVAEEVLRNYFISIGYFVVRGCKFRFDGFDVTDIDLWLYGKKSAVTRERINVDIKNKKTPQALERIFWAKGLQDILGFDGCIVATTDSRPSVKSFGLKHEIRVLDGEFLQRLGKSVRSHQDRIYEEDLMVMIKNGSLGKLGGDWMGIYEQGKSRLLDNFTFDGCNSWLADSGYFLEQASSDHSEDAPATRLLYLTVSKFLIVVDFLLSRHIAADHNERRQILDSGFRYGSAGKSFSDKMGNLMASLVGSVTSDIELGNSVRHAFETQVQALKADHLSDYLARGNTISSLFDVSKEFESAGFSSKVPNPLALSSACQSILGILADFYDFDRKRVLF